MKISSLSILFFLLTFSLNGQVGLNYYEGEKVVVLGLHEARVMDLLARKGLKLDRTVNLYTNLLENYKQYRTNTSLIIYQKESKIKGLRSEIEKWKKIDERKTSITNNAINNLNECEKKADKLKSQKRNIILIGSAILVGSLTTVYFYTR